MKRTHTILVGCAVLIFAATVYAQRRANERTYAPRGQEDLAAKVERLEDQVARLEAQVQDLRGRRDINVTPPVPAPAPSPLPKGWQGREFNGLRYYIVPCDQTVVVPATQPVK
jgi:hypothetical protein